MSSDVLKYLSSFLENESLSYFCFEFSPPIDMTKPYPIQAEQALKNSRLIMCNESFATGYGAKKEEILNKSYFDILPEHQEALAFLEHFAGVGYKFENDIATEVDSDGVTLHTLNNIWPTIQDDQLISIFGIDINMTEQIEREKKVEARDNMLSTILSVIPVGIYQSDEMGKITFGNATADKILGESFDNSNVDDWIKDMNEEDKARFIKAYKTSIISKTRFSKEYSMTKKDGSIQHLFTESVPIYNKENQYRGMIGFISDISDRIEYEHKLERSLMEREMLLSEIHHRVKNNLAIISSLIDLQRYSIKNDALDEELLNIRSRIMSMASVHKLLYESKNFSDISIEQLIQKLCSEIHSSFASDYLDVRFDIFSSDLSLNANQAVPFGLIMNELITNSYKHGFRASNQGKIAIDLTYNKNIIELTYVDNGTSFVGNYTLSTIPQDSLGFQLIYNLAMQLDATSLDISDRNGFNFNMSFPFENELKKGSTISREFSDELKQLFG